MSNKKEMHINQLIDEYLKGGYKVFRPITNKDNALNFDFIATNGTTTYVVYINANVCDFNIENETLSVK